MRPSPASSSLAGGENEFSGANDVRDGLPGAKRAQGAGHRWTVKMSAMMR